MWTCPCPPNSGHSSQLRALKDYARANGYSVAREYVDEAESGRVADRPQFREMIEEGSQPKAPFEVILVWKFSRFTRKREHAVAFKSTLRRKGIRVVSITEHAEDNATGRLLEGIIESVDEFYSENLAQDVTRGMREAASQGFFMGPKAPFGYRKVYVQDGAKKRPKLEPDPPADAVVKRIFDLALQGKSTLDITRTLNAEGVASPRSKQWLKSAVHNMLTNEAYTGAVVWGTKAKDGAPPVRVEKAFTALVLKSKFRQVARLLRSRAPKSVHPRRASSPYLLSGLVKCKNCRSALSGQDTKSGRFAYYVCGTLFREGAGTCSAQAQRPALRGVGRLKDTLQRAHRVQHPGVGDAGGRGDRRDRKGATPEAGDHRRRARGREAQAGTALRPGGDHRPGHRRLQAPHQRPQGTAGEA